MKTIQVDNIIDGFFKAAKEYKKCAIILKRGSVEIKHLHNWMKKRRNNKK